MSALDSNAAARLPFLKPLNTPHTTTAASHSAASAQVAAAAQGDSHSEFSRLLVRSQNAAAVSQRTAAPAGKAPPPHRPVSPEPTPRNEAAPAADEPGSDVDAPDASDSSAATSHAHSSERAAAAPSKSKPSPDTEPTDLAMTEPAGADATGLNDPLSAVVPTAPTAAELLSLAAWGALPMPPATSPTTPVGEATDEAGTGTALAAESLASNNSATELPLRSDRESATRSPADKAALGVEAGLAAATANAHASDTALAQLELLAAGVRPESERLHHGSELATPPAWAIGAPGASTLSRAVDAAAPPAAASVATPLTDSGFHEALGMQVSLLAREGIHKAELRLNPADMGPVSVQITMHGDQARVDFGADLAQTRQVIEAGWAELAASLREAGFTLSGGGVSEHARNRHEPSAAPARGADRSAHTEEVPVASVVAARLRAGAALDLYA